MAALWISLLAGLVAAGTASYPAPAPLHARFPLTENFPPPPAGDRGFDVLSYDLGIRLDPAASWITGQVALGLRALEVDLATVQLDLVADLTCTGVFRRGSPLAFDHQGDSLLVFLPTPLAAGSIDTLDISWEGRPPRHGEMLVGLLFRQHNAGTPDAPADDVPIIANISEPWSAHSWWPCKDHPADKALVSLAATVPDSLRVVSNGTLLGIDSEGPDWHTFRWREQYPLPTYLVGVAASNYVSWYETCGTVPLEFHVFPQDEAKARFDFAPTCDMLDFLNGLAGPYPFAGEKYAQVEIKWVGAIEHTTASSISQLLITGDGKYETLVLHELAHQWFGDSLTPAVWADIWLNEGFARYAEALWIEHRYGREAYTEFMADIGRRRHADLFQEQGILADPSPILPNALVYDKGAWLLHSLRLLLGDEGFFSLLRSYAEDPDLAQGSVRTEDFRRHAEVAAGRSLEDFFRPWLHTSAVPRIAVEIISQPQTARVRLRQLQDELFAMAIPIRLQTAGGQQDELAVLTGREKVFRWETSTRLTGVTVDPDTLVFMEQGPFPAPPLAVQGPWPNPVGAAGATWQLFLREAGTVEARLFDVRGRRRLTFDLGERPATGPENDPDSRPQVWAWHPDQDPDQGGAALSSGVYWWEFRSGQARSIRKMVLVR